MNSKILLRYLNHKIKMKGIKGKIRKNDIVFILVPYAFVLQTKKNCNNLFVIKLNNEYIKSKYFMTRLIYFIRRCHINNNIDYIRINGENERYKYIQKHYSYCTVKEDNDTFYVDVKKLLENLYKDI